MWFDRNWNPGKETQETKVRFGSPGWVTTEDQYLHHVSLDIICDHFLFWNHFFSSLACLRLIPTPAFPHLEMFSKSTKWEGTKDSSCLPMGRIVAEYWRNRTENCSHQRLRTCRILLLFMSKFSNKSTYSLIREEVVLCMSAIEGEREREGGREREDIVVGFEKYYRYRTVSFIHPSEEGGRSRIHFASKKSPEHSFTRPRSSAKMGKSILDPSSLSWKGENLQENPKNLCTNLFRHCSLQDSWHDFHGHSASRLSPPWVHPKPNQTFQ